MKMNSQGGYVSGTLVGLIVVSVLLAAALGFGGWAFASRLDYKNNSDQKVAKAVAQAQKDTENSDAAKYAEEAKSPIKTHKGPDQFGSVTVKYPKTWSGYVGEQGTGNQPVDDYFYPDVVPSTDQKNVTYALRIQVVQESYDHVIASYQSDVTSKKLSAAPTTLAKVPGTVGTRFVGQLEADKQGVLIVLPMRNLTLKVWTESQDFLPDFENTILPNLTFAP